jgi:hypothetical protein
MRQKVDVLHVIVSLVLSLQLLLWFAWVDALEDAETPEQKVEYKSYDDAVCCMVLEVNIPTASEVTFKDAKACPRG